MLRKKQERNPCSDLFEEYFEKDARHMPAYPPVLQEDDARHVENLARCKLTPSPNETEVANLEAQRSVQKSCPRKTLDTMSVKVTAVKLAHEGGTVLFMNAELYKPPVINLERRCIPCDTG